MTFKDFIKQPRGPYHFDTWLYKLQVPSSIGNLPLELYTDIDGVPSQEMINLAHELAVYAAANGEELLNIVHAHYRKFELKGWLSYWGVPSGLSRTDVLRLSDSITLNVHSDLYASVLVDPKWDPEHQLALTFCGKINEINEEPFDIIDGVLS